MTTRELVEALEKRGACKSAVRRVKRQKSPAAAWRAASCTQLVWVLDRLGLLPRKRTSWHAKRLGECADHIRREVPYRRLLELATLRALRGSDA